MDEALIKNLMWAFGGVLVGGSLSYFITKKVVSEKYETILDIEIAAAKEHYADEKDKRDRLRKEGDYATPESAAEKLGRRMADEYGPDNSQDEEIAQSATVTIEVDDMPDISTLDRDEEYPYVITYDEYHDDMIGHEKITLTYYEDDLVLADDDDASIDDQDDLIGDDTLDRFGQWSKDPKIVYVRNENISTDFEIIKKSGSYAEIVHGIRPERERLRRMREE